MGTRSALMLFVLVVATTVSSVSAQICPALSSLASSCRNGICEAGLREDANNCPEDCADRSTQLLGFYTQAISCPSTTIYEPQTIFELQEHVRTVVSSGRKVKPAGTSHSATDLICADSNGDVVRTSKLKRIGQIESFESTVHTVEFEAGTTFVELQEHLAALGYSMGFAATGYGGISIGGAVATGAHGSSLNGSSTISSYIIGMDVVGADGQLRSYSEGTTGVTSPDLWRALKTNLGLLGIVVRLRIEVEPQFNLNVQVLSVTEDQFVNQPNGVANAISACDYVFLTWFPGQDTVRYLCGNRTTDPVDSPHAQNRLFTPAISGFEQAFAIPTLQLGMCDNTVTGCFVESQRVSTYQQSPPLVIASDSTPSGSVQSRHNDLTGYAHRMITLQPDIFLSQPSLSQLEYEGALPMSQIQSAVQYLKSIYDRDGVCQPLIGTIMRFDVADDSLLVSANAVRPGLTAGEQMVHLEFVEYWGYEAGQSIYDNYISNPYTEIVTHLVQNFNYWPHWGKNDEWVFDHAAVKARNQAAVTTFNQQIAALDPYGVFSNVSTRRSGFSSPQEGGDFASFYYGACALQDNDLDGISNCTDHAVNDFSGMYTRIDDDGIISGTCNVADSWDEMQSNFGTDQEQPMRGGWNYDSENHSYHAGTFNWNPAWPNNGGTSWEAMMSAEFLVPESGRYCFSQDIGATGTSIVTGRNACGQVWLNKSIVAEVGFNSSNTPVGCVDLDKNERYRLDFYNRHHNANVFRSFISRPKWCYGLNDDCTPDRNFEQNRLIAYEPLTLLPEIEEVEEENVPVPLYVMVVLAAIFASRVAFLRRRPTH